LVPSPLTLSLILKNFNIWPNLTASSGMKFIPSPPQLSSQRRDEMSGMWLRHMQMRFTAPPLATPWERWWLQTENPTGTIKLMTLHPQTRWSPAYNRVEEGCPKGC
jgi:hypothetical protein